MCKHTMGQAGRTSKTLRVVCLLITSLLLFAAPPARAQDLRAGYAKVDITPTGPVDLGGYDLRGTPSDGIYDRLYARALIFEASGVRVAFVEADVIGIGFLGTQQHDASGAGSRSRRASRSETSFWATLTTTPLPRPMRRQRRPGIPSSRVAC